MIKKISSLLVSVSFLISSFGCVTYRPPRQAPPPGKVVVKPLKPGPNYVWVAGHWSWKGGRYHWVNGHWLKKKRGKVWVAGHWKKKRGRWIWVPGHWR